MPGTCQAADGLALLGCDDGMTMNVNNGKLCVEYMMVSLGGENVCEVVFRSLPGLSDRAPSPQLFADRSK